MKLHCSIWILWTTLACTTAPNILKSATPPALSFVISPTEVYELEDTPALIWRNGDEPLTDKAFYFSNIILACPESSVIRHAIEKKSITKSVAFIYKVMEPQRIPHFTTHPLLCEKNKKYHAYAVPIIRLNNRYEVNPEMIENRNRQEFSIGYEVVDDRGELHEKHLPTMERFHGMSERSGWLEAFKVVYDIEKLIARQVSYELNFLGESEIAPGYCENYELGRIHDFLKGVNFQKAYWRGAQIGQTGTLREVIRPGGQEPPSVKKADVNEAFRMKLVQQDLPNLKKPRLVMAAGDFQPTDEQYMIMQQLAPIEYFDVFTAQWSTCTYLNVVPMWISLANGPWKRVDQAIRKMLYVIDKLSIIAGTYGVLQLPKRRPPHQYQNVYLRTQTKNIAIPKLFYKFVVHKVPLPGGNGAPFSYGIIIVMHNDFGVPTERICAQDPLDLCTDYGWDVGSEDDKIARPYCCKPSPETLTALDITSYSSNLGYLDLNNVVLEITGDGENLVRNYNQFQLKQYPMVAKKKGKTKKLNDIYF